MLLPFALTISVGGAALVAHQPAGVATPFAARAPHRRLNTILLSLEEPLLLNEESDGDRVSAADSSSRRVLTLPGPDGAAGALPPLPTLDAKEEQRLRDGKRVRWQEPPGAGGYGRGFTVQELKADVDDVWRAVSAFDDYARLISTVRSVTTYDVPEGEVDGWPEATRYSYLVSRIRLRLDVRFTVDEDERYAAWALDRPSWVLNDSTGYWRVEPCEGRPGYVRVWFCVCVRLTRRVPGFVVALVSRLGLDKATRWVKALEK